MRTEQIKVRVFIEGIRIPFITSVAVQSHANESSTATIVMPPILGFETEELKRARVHIFWSDIEQRENPAEDEWPLLFEGEIVADSYSKSPTHRSQAFHCAGYHTYWEQVLLYYYDQNAGAYSQPVWTQQLAISLGNSQFQFDGQVPGANLRQRLVTEIKDNEDKSYSSIVKTVFGKVLDSNHFFRTQNEDLLLNQRFVTPKDENIDVLIGRSLFREAVSKDILSISGQKSMMEVLKATLELFRYQIVCNPQPVLMDAEVQERRTETQKKLSENSVRQRLIDYVSSALEGKVTDSTRVNDIVTIINGQAVASDITNAADRIIVDVEREDDTALRAEIVKELKTINELFKDVTNATVEGDDQVDRSGDTEDLLSQFMIIPDTRFAIPPTCNIIFPQDQTSLNLERQLMQEPTRGISLPFEDANLPFRVYMAPPEIDKAVIPGTIVKSVSTQGFHPPVTAPHRITSKFGLRNLKSREVNPTGKRRPHEGVDVGVKVGTPIHAIDDGKVIRSGWQDKDDPKKGFGMRIYIAHANGFISRYAHLSEIQASAVEDKKVKAGDVIGASGNTGSSTGPHLHFEIRYQKKAVDPLKLFDVTTSGGNTRFADPPAEGAEENESVETDAVPVSDVAVPGGNFNDFEFLTPEEKITGIIPFFDLNTLRSQSFMSFVGTPEETTTHLLQMLNSEYQWRRYQTRSLGALNMPFNPNPVAGFPALVVDRNRSLIGKISSIQHMISVGGGQGNATTTVQVEAPRYWDEGDPYFWDLGEEAMKPLNGKNLPDPIKANFPLYYLKSLVGTNSAAEDIWWKKEITTEPFVSRSTDKLYRQLFGGTVRGLDYQFATRKTNRGTVVAYNKAIDSRPVFNESEGTESEKPPNVNTIVGRYYHYADKDPSLSERYVHGVTKRRGVTEKDLMTRVLAAELSQKLLGYVGPAFRSGYQTTVRKMVRILTEDQQFRG